MAGGGPSGGVACGQAQEEALGAGCLAAGGRLYGLGFAFGRGVFPTRTARAALVAGCGWPLWSAPTVGDRESVGLR
ncbi:hypothetical protein EV567_0921 [Streptomyces sp. BK239]|nr:hypothetical protein EV567_0921 [Streptomyces sp. BK239]